MKGQVFLGAEDYNYPLKVGEYLYQNISSEDKTIKIYEGLYNEILNEKVKDIVIDDMISWLDKRI